MSETLTLPHPSVLAPLPYTLPVVGTAHVKRTRSPAGVLAGLLMFAAAIWLAVQNDMFRAFEARLVTPLAGFVVGGESPVRVHDIVYFALGSSRRFGLHLTDECTSALLLIPLLVLMGFLAIFSRLSLRRQLFALLCGSVLIVVVNLLRMAGIAYSTWEWGFNPGYEYSHVFVGSAFSLVGFVGAVLLALWILVRGDRPKRVPALATAAMSAAAASAVSASATAGSAAPGVSDVAPAAEVVAARTELADLRTRFEADLAHLRDRFDTHLVAAQQRERAALERSVALETALEQADVQRGSVEDQRRAEAHRADLAEARSAEARALLTEFEARSAAAETRLAHAEAHSAKPAHRVRPTPTPTPDQVRSMVADVERRIESLARRLQI